MDYPEDLKYTKDHEWLRVEGSEAQMGISDFAQSELGEVVYIDLPELGRVIDKGEVLCVVESTKAASDVYAPISGVVVEINELLANQADLVNSDPYGDGWMVRIKDIDLSELDNLLSATEYVALVE